MTAMQDLNSLAEQLRSGVAQPVVVEGQSISCASVYETPRSLSKIYMLRPGQMIPAHQHSAIDDVFLGVRGRGRIRIWGADGEHVDHLIEAGTVLVVEPGNPHEVSCAGDEFCYVLTQSPKEKYDSVGYAIS